jgi:outer membrane protein TolC
VCGEGRKEAAKAPPPQVGVALARAQFGIQRSFLYPQLGGGYEPQSSPVDLPSGPTSLHRRLPT